MPLVCPEIIKRLSGNEISNARGKYATYVCEHTCGVQIPTQYTVQERISNNFSREIRTAVGGGGGLKI